MKINAKTILLIIQLLIYFLLISCLLVGDTYLTYMIFNSNTYTCEAFDDTSQPTTIAATTTLPVISRYALCYNLSDTEIGFIRFKIIIFWILFVSITCVVMYMLVKLYPKNPILFGIIIAITLIMSIFIIIGGIFMTQYGFSGHNKKCLNQNSNVPHIKSTQYCYNMNDVELHFAKISVVFGWLFSIVAIITIGLFMWEINFG